MLRRGRKLGGWGRCQNFDVNILTRHYFDIDIRVKLLTRVNKLARYDIGLTAVASMQLIK